MSKQLIFDPLEEYRDRFKGLHNENVNKFFDELLKKSAINVEENDFTVKEINTLNGKIANEEKALGKARALQAFLLFLTIVGFIIFIAFLVLSTPNNEDLLKMPTFARVIIAVLGLALAITTIVVVRKKIKPRIRDSQTRLSALIEQREAKVSLAWSQVNPLNALFDANMTPMLVEKTIPILTMDPYFDARRLDYLVRKYGLGDFTPDNESALFVQSGEIQGNPFLLARVLNMTMGTKTYRGSLVVTYTVTVYVDGKARRETRSETLVATVNKPCPYYDNDTYIIYGNEAAPNLVFTRYPQLPLDWTEKSLRRFVEKEKREMEKISAKALKQGRQFTPIGNTEFEALFNAYDRNHELEYRLLFTALGQSEILDLIKDKTVGFGDNFQFFKNKNLNMIRSHHSQVFDYSGDPQNYYHYDNQEIRRRFVNYNNDYLHRFYFNIAPVLAIPLYQQHKPHEFIYEKEYQSHLSFYEHESTVNQFPSSAFSHPDSHTQNILKTKIVQKGKDFDTVSVTSHGFTTVERVDYVAKTAGNGSVHMVPVPWTEYIPVERESHATIKVLDQENVKKAKDQSFFDKIGEYLSKYTPDHKPVTGRHVMAFIVGAKFIEQDNEELDKLFK
ncbi:MAG: hypothetical protein BWY30_00019 [Tenericutes bacterium ADurb.Bin239]|nr:MAG: hypothetical protein BWY30_00019 [Tenericutes bacterium ADurb.Bin239]